MVQSYPRAFKKRENKWCSRLVLTCQFHSAVHNQRQEEPARMPSKSIMVLNAQEAGQKKKCALSAGQRTSQSDSQAKPQKPKKKKKERRKENERTLYLRPRSDCHACEPPRQDKREVGVMSSTYTLMRAACTALHGKISTHSSGVDHRMEPSLP